MAKTPPLRFNEYTQEYTLTAEEKADYEEAKRRAYAGMPPMHTAIAAPKALWPGISSYAGTISASAATKPRDGSMDVVEAILKASIYAGDQGVMLRTSGKDVHIYHANDRAIDVMDSRDYVKRGESMGTVRDFLLFLAKKSKEV